jgi:ATP-dependent exoDNAse (exonuclease V) beta subunit
MARSEQKHWQLIENPARLRIQTIDSLCASLVKQMPLLAQFGATPGIEENAMPLYKKAVEAFLSAVLIDRSLPDVESALIHLLKSLNNQLNTLIDLLTILLARRDQWIRHFVKDRRLLDRQQLESALTIFIRNKIQSMAQYAPSAVGALLSEVLALIHQCLASSDLELPSDHFVFQIQELSGWPKSDISALTQWQSIARLLFTKEGKLKKRFTKNDGVLGPSAAKGKSVKQLANQLKDKLSELTEALSNYTKFCDDLMGVLNLPEPQFNDLQWKTIESLNASLNYLLGFLRIEFQSRGKVDFIELSLAALRALEDEYGATDLALKLDYQIKHILVDEFQDTSHGQYQLLKLLTQGWQKGDGRTLFVVGDPMQSIYRFREADVGLYLNSRQQGVGDIELIPLTLSTNFRSVQGVVDWVNRAFKKVFPLQEDALLGAVPLSIAVANRKDDAPAVEFVHALSPAQYFQAKEVLARIRAIRSNEPNESIAILVRNKAHAQEIIRLLKQSNIPVEAIEMERLDQRAMIKNLRNLTRVLVNPSDNLAWTGLLRSDFCGLALTSIHQLFLISNNLPTAIKTVIEQPDRLANAEEMKRLHAFYTRLAPFIDNICDKPIAVCVRAAWFALGGPQLNSNERDLRDADQYFSSLNDKLSDNPIANVALLDEMIEQLFSAPEVSEDDQVVKVMTIHKSKGLEFDHVFIPHLEKQPRNERSQLILWQELSTDSETDNLGSSLSDKGSHFLVAPMKLGDSSADRIYGMLDEINKAKQMYENGRLLYVGATRAKKRLYLLAESSVDIRDEEFCVKLPHKGSLLHQLWPVVEEQVNQQLKHYDEPAAQLLNNERENFRLTRIDCQQPLTYFAPKLKPQLIQNTLSSEPENREIEWENATAATVGILVHEYLQIIAEQGLDDWTKDRVVSLAPTLKQCLRQSAVDEKDIPSSVDLVIEAITKTIDDTDGRWVLSYHQSAESELALSIKVKDRFATYVIDRTFIDEQGVRWIIDFKTSHHKGSNLDAFFQQELERYRPQLQQYALMMSQSRPEPIRCALYLPMHQRLLQYPENFHL